MPTEKEVIQSDIRRTEFGLWAMTDEMSRRTAAIKKEKEKLEATINADKTLLQGVLAQALMNLKLQRPNLFYLTDQDQMVSLARLFFRFVTK